MKEDCRRLKTGAELGLEVVGRWKDCGFWVGEGSGRGGATRSEEEGFGDKDLVTKERSLA